PTKMATELAGQEVLYPPPSATVRCGVSRLVSSSAKNGKKCMAGITCTKDDATCLHAKGIKIICHVCNDIRDWGKGFVLAISRRWKQPDAVYRIWHGTGKQVGFILGAVQFVQVEPYMWVANMVRQRVMKRGSPGPPIRYEAVATCLQQVAVKAREL